MIATQEDGLFSYAGTVGTGFTSKLLKELYTMLKPLERKTPPVTEVVKEKGMHWVEPRYVCQVQYTELTTEGHVRHPSYLGLRNDKQL
jgi:bifunctional non-homologous end joining protein LigD